MARAGGSHHAWDAARGMTLRPHHYDFHVAWIRAHITFVDTHGRWMGYDGTPISRELARFDGASQG